MMYREDIIAKIKEYEKLIRETEATGYHGEQYKKLLREKIESYKRLLKHSRKKKTLSPLEEVFGRKPYAQRRKK